MKITATTKPSTLMFEGRPEIEITAISPRPSGFWLDNKPEFYIRSKSPTAPRVADGAYNEDGICTSSMSGHKLPIVERFRLTADTNPTTVMIEGHPEVTITGISERPAKFCDGTEQVYVSLFLDGKRGQNAYYLDGRHAEGVATVGNIGRASVVPRLAAPTIDWHKPVFSTYEDNRIEIRVHALVTPIDPAKPPYVELSMKPQGEIVWGPPAPFSLDGQALTARGSGHTGKLTNTPPRRTETVMTTSGVKVLITYLGNEPISAELAG